jgi:hypothetical protein
MFLNDLHHLEDLTDEWILVVSYYKLQVFKILRFKGVLQFYKLLLKGVTTVFQKLYLNSAIVCT